MSAALARGKHARFTGLALLVLLAAGGFFVAPRLAPACALAAWWWALGLVLGVFTNAWMHVLTGGAWGAPVRATALALSPRLVALLPGLALVALCAGLLYPWAREPAAVWTRGIARPAFLQAWLSPVAFDVRLALYAAAWFWATRPASLAHKGRAGASLAVHGVASSLASVDLVMSLVPGWRSTAFGLLVLCTQALAGAALAVPLALRTRSWLGAPRVPVSRDIGNLLLMWSMSWGYLAFVQFLVIWAENLPRETAWYLPRLQTTWRWVGVALALLLLSMPFVALLWRRVKDDPRRLTWVAALLLVGSALDVLWTIAPSVDAGSLHVVWLAPLAFAGMALLAFAGVQVEGAGSARHEAACAGGNDASRTEVRHA